jgi:hypothetical protein
MKRGRPIVFDKPFREAQTKVIAAKRIVGQSIEDIAKEHNMHPMTVKRRLQQAKREGILEDIVDGVVEKLLPLALKAYEKALEEGDLAAARDVMHGLGILRKDGRRESVSEGEAAELTLRVWRQRRRAFDDETDYQAQLEAGSELPTLDADPTSAEATSPGGGQDVREGDVEEA